MGANSAIGGARVESVRFATLVLAVARALRFSLGLLATLLIARAFGTRPETDAFFVALIIPITFMEWAGNILKVGFIPTVAEVRARQGEGAARAVSFQFAGYTFLRFLAVALLLFAGAQLVVGALAPGFAAATRSTGASMLRVLAPSILFSAFFLTSETILNAWNHFSAPARGRVVGRVAILASLLLLSGPLGPTALPVSFLIGSAVQLVGMGRPGWRIWSGFVLKLRPVLPGTRTVLSLLVPALIWMLLDQLKFVVDQIFASRLAAGHLSALGYAFRIVQFVVTVTAGAYLTALFPRLSEMMAAGKSVAEESLIAGRRVLFVAAFPTIFFLGAAQPVVTFLLERGSFTDASTEWTTGALLFYAPAILTISFNMLLKILLFLTRRTGWIFLVGVLELALNVALDALLVGPMGVRGLALATSVTTIVVMIALPGHLSREGVLVVRRMAGAACRLVPGAVIGYLAVRVVVDYGSDVLLVHSLSDSWIALGGLLAAAGLFGAVFYGAGVVAMGSQLWPRRASKPGRARSDPRNGVSDEGGGPAD